MQITTRLLSIYLVLLLSSHLYAQERNFTTSNKKTEKRIALLVGNNAYGGGKALKGIPINDINDFEVKLKELNFEVVKVADVNLIEFKRSIREFGTKLNAYDVCLFYYSGHGIQSNRRALNYMIPIGANDLCNDAEIDDQCVNMDYVIDYMKEAEIKTKIIFFDACRNFPSGCSKDFNGRGMANVGAEGILISYATQSGDVALNTLNNRNSPYVESMLKRIAEPNLSINDMLTAVNSDVYKGTKERQRPWINNNLLDMFYFNKLEELPKDSDGDGVMDSEDECIMIRGPKSNNGCPINSSNTDSDGDGLTDDKDKCPFQKGDIVGFGCPDTDGDRVYDWEDKCPNEKGLPSNDGCPAPEKKEEKDSDEDGIIDKDDKCPDEYGPLSNHGCPTKNTPASNPDFKVTFVQANMIQISGSNFTLGCNIGEVNCDKDEFPKKNVSISTFYIQKNEVTNSQFLAFLNAYKSDIVKEGEYAGQKIIYPSTSGLTKKGGVWATKEGYENHPVVDVTWFGALTFAKYYGLRLPTEAEWEFIAKGGKNNHNYIFAGGNNLYNIGVYEGNSNFDSADVGSKGDTHVLGVNDMSGNVWEWCQDWYSPNYNTAATTNPKGPNSGTAKVIRGGSYSEGEWEARVTNRSYKEPITHSNTIGFRCAK